MNCPRCGSHKTSRAFRKEGKGKKAVTTNIMEERCNDCGWYGNHIVEPIECLNGSKPSIGEEKK